MRKSILITALTTSIIFSSCATIVSGSKQLVKFTSNPSTATIFIDEVEVGKTPFEIKLERKKEHHVMIKLDGYKTFETNLTKKFNAWYIGNIAFGGLIGLIIDPITGAIYKLTPSEINAQLENGVAFKGDNKNVYISVALEIDPSWEKVGQLERK